MMGARSIAAIAIALVVGATAAGANDKKQRPATPWLEFDPSFQLRFDWTAASDNPDNRIKQLFIEHGDFEFGLHMAEWLVLRAHIAAGAVRPPLPGRDAWFRGFAMHMEELYVELDFEHVGLRAGKLNPAFGVAHNEKTLRGTGAVGFTQGYELTEMIGFGMTLRPDLTARALGRHTLAAHLFFADTTFLDHSIITTPRATDASFTRLGDRRLGDGGLANTNRPDNVALSLSGRGFEFAPRLGYTLGFRLLRAGPAGLAAGSETRDETGYGVAFDHSFTIAPGAIEARVLPMVEWAHLRNPGGNPGVTNFWTAAVGIEQGPWELWLSGTLRSTVAVPGAPDARDRLFAVSLDRGVADWLKAGVGYRWQRINGISDHIIGLRLWVYDHMEIALR